MKIQYASDLHLEFAENHELLERGGGIVPVGDVLVLAGDVSYLGDRKMMKRPFFDWCAEHFRETFIVPGNHEFYQGYDIGQTLVDYEFEYRENVRYLNNASVMLDDTELFFTTLWTRISPLFLREIQRGMNDFRYGDWRDATALQPTWVYVLWREQGLSAGCGGRGIDYLSQSLIQ